MIVKLLLIDLDLSVARNHSAAKSAYFDWSSANRIKEPRIQDEWDHWGGCSAKSATIDLTIVLQKLLCLPTIELIALQDLNLMLHDLQDSITPFEMSCSWPLMLILVFQKLEGTPNSSIYIKIKLKVLHLYVARPEVEDVAFACPGLGDGSTEFLLSVLDVSFPIEDLDEVEVAIVWLLKKRDSFFSFLYHYHFAPENFLGVTCSTILQQLSLLGGIQKNSGIN